jgi:integrase
MKHLLPPGGVNPFDGVPSREQSTIFRKPFSADELSAIIEAAQSDDFIRPIIVTGICTAMRRGDCCRLRWVDVDMVARFINVKT